MVGDGTSVGTGISVGERCCPQKAGSVKSKVEYRVLLVRERFLGICDTITPKALSETTVSKYSDPCSRPS